MRVPRGIATIRRWVVQPFSGAYSMSKGKPSAQESPPGRAVGHGPCPVYAVYGPDDFLRREALREITVEVLGAEPPPMARADFNGPEADLADVLDEARTLPFLAEVRLVVVHDADALITKHREALERYVGAPSTTGTLVLICKVMNKQWRLTKAIQKAGRLIECKPPPPWERDKWVAGRAGQAYGKKMTAQTAQTLVAMAGDDMASLDAELAKLSIYVGQRDTIDGADVGALVGLTRPETVFRMTDALADGDAATALAVWRQTLATDTQAVYRAVGGIAWAVRQMIAVKRGTPRGASRSTSRAAGRFTLEQLQAMLVQLLAADVAGKTGLGSVEAAIEKFVVRQCARR